MAIGAVFGALNTMYSSVSARTREIATLRALGFGSGAVVVSVMLESIALALLGGAIGAGLSPTSSFNGFQTATMNWQSFSQITFAFAVTPQLLVQGMVWATLIGRSVACSPRSAPPGSRSQRRCASSDRRSRRPCRGRGVRPAPLPAGLRFYFFLTGRIWMGPGGGVTFPSH